MKVPKSYEGKFVCAHLGTPVYMCEYGAHVTLEGGKPQLMPAPMMKTVATPEGTKQSQAMSNLLTGALVAEVGDDYVVFELFDPDPAGTTGTVTHKLVPSQLILSLDTVQAVEFVMPGVTRRVPAQPSRIVQP